MSVVKSVAVNSEHDSAPTTSTASLSKGKTLLKSLLPLLISLWLMLLLWTLKSVVLVETEVVC